MDLFVLKAIVEELNNQLASSMVSKIYQINADDLLIQFWGPGTKRLYISVHPELGRLHLTGHKPFFPPAPPRFAAYLRSHLSGARLVNIGLTPFDRVATLTFQKKRPDETTEALHLVVELLGRHGNVIITDENYTILESLRRVSARESQIRQVLPGEKYQPLPSLPGRMGLANLDREALGKQLSVENKTDRTEGAEDRGGRPSDPSLLRRRLQQLVGLGPILAWELSLGSTGDTGLLDFEALWKALEEWQTFYPQGPFLPQILRLAGGEETLSALDLSHLPVVSREVFPDMSQAADAFYFPLSMEQTFQEEGRRLLRCLQKEQKRLVRKKQNLEGDWRKLEGYLKLKEIADLLISQQASATKGDSSARLINYYSPQMEAIEVPLDVRLSPKENAELYYKKYRKARKGLDVVADFLARVGSDLAYLEDLLYQSEEAEDLETLSTLSLEAGEAFGRKTSDPEERPSSEKRRETRAGTHHERKEDEVSRQCRRFYSSEGWEILCGKSSRGNDWLLKRAARSEDIWLHAHGLPGAHVLLKRRSSGEVPENTLLEAAQIAAYFSRGKNSTKVSVIYTPAKNVRKLPKGKPGQVTVANYQTILVRPEQMRSEEWILSKSSPFPNG